MASGNICGSSALQQNINLKMMNYIHSLNSMLGLLAPRNHLLVLVRGSVGNSMIGGDAIWPMAILCGFAAL